MGVKDTGIWVVSDCNTSALFSTWNTTELVDVIDPSLVWKQQMIKNLQKQLKIVYFEHYTAETYRIVPNLGPLLIIAIFSVKLHGIAIFTVKLHGPKML